MKMNEGRQTQVVLLDDRTLDILIKPRLLSSELLDLVSSHFNIKEKEYFGLAYPDESSHFNWLTLDKRVLEHEYPKKTGLLTLYFAIRFYIQSITQLRDKSTVEAFVISAKSLIFKGEIECDSETAFELAAYVLQSTHSDYESDAKARDDLKKLPVIPTSALQEHPSLEYCEDRVIYHYQNLAGTEKGLALVNYMTIVESLPTYGIHYYEVKDKKDIPWWLGISFKGIAVYDKNDRKTPRRLFMWRQLENLYYRDKKFSIEVHDPKRIVQSLSSFNLYEDAIKERADTFDSLSDAITDPTTQVSVSRRALGPGNVNVHAWFASTPQLTKSVWSMAVAQHQFYLDRKHSRSQLPAARSMSEIAAELSRSSVSLTSSNLSSDLSSYQRSVSTHSLPSLSASKFELNYEDLEQTREAQRDMFEALKARKDALEDTLKKKLEELKLLCIKEGELSGELPPETPIYPGENPPLIRRRIGTAFTLSPSVVQRTENDATDNELSQLELEYDLQSKISNAALKLSKDKTVPRKLRKQRQQSYQKAQAKLKETGMRLAARRKVIGAVNHDMNSAFIAPGGYTKENVIGRSDSGMYSESSMMSSDESLMSRQLSSSSKQNLQDSCYSSDGSRYSSSYTSILPPHANMPTTPSNKHQASRHSGGYITSPIYSTQTQYRTGRYPTISSPADNDSVSLRREPRYGSEDSIREVKSLNSLTARYDSMEELKSPTPSANHNGSYIEANRYMSPLPPYQGPQTVISRASLHDTSPGYYGSLDRQKQRKNKTAAATKTMPKTDNCDQSKTRSRPGPVESEINSPIEPAYRDHIPRRDETAYDSSTSPRVSCSDSVSYVSRRSDLSTCQDNAYSPRYAEGAYRYYERKRDHKPQRHSGSHLIVKRESPVKNVTQMSPSLNSPISSSNYSPHEETSKPYEMADFYKYSEKFRRRRAVEFYHQALIGSDQVSVSSLASQYSTDSEKSFQSPGRRYIPHSSQSSPIGSSRSSDVSTPLTHRPPPAPFSNAHAKQTTQLLNNNNTTTPINPYSAYNNATNHGNFHNSPAIHGNFHDSSANHGTFPNTSSSNSSLANYVNYPRNYIDNSGNYANNCGNYASYSGHYNQSNSSPHPGSYASPPNYETTMMNVANNTSMSYRTNVQNTSPERAVYTPPRPMTCDPVSDTYYQKRLPRNSLNIPVSNNSSLNNTDYHGNTHITRKSTHSLVDGYRGETLAWLKEADGSTQDATSI